MLALALLLTALAAGPPPAEPPPAEPLHPGAVDEAGPLDIEGWSVLAYNGFLVDSSFRVSEDLKRAVERLPKDADPERLAAFRAQLVDAFRKGEQRLLRLPGWHGDASFRDVALAAVRWGLAAVEERVAELHDLVHRADVASADLDRAEALVRGINEEGRTWDLALREAQKAFAARAGFTLVEAPPKPPTKAPPTFTAPGIPPEGSALPATVHVGFATRYHNRLVTRQLALLDAFNAFVAATAEHGEAAEARRLDALAVARAVDVDARATGPWRGDAGLRDATIDLSSTLVRLLDGPAADAADLLGRERLTNEERGRYDLAIGIVNQDSTASLRRWDEAARAFRARFGMDAWEAWRAAHP